MSKIKTIAIIAIIFVALCSVIAFLRFRINNLQEELSIYDNNFKALNLENSKLQEDVIAYRLDIEQLEYINDSIIEDLNTTRRELKIKDKELLQMQKIKTEIITKDSIFFRDTIFKDNLVKLDTLLGDDWYKIKLQLEYPNKIGIQANYKSDLNVFAHSSKEIIGTPKKCFIGRWFQKKHKVIRVDVIDKNPHAIITEKKFIIIE
jgi:hypothetical protein